MARVMYILWSIFPRLVETTVSMDVPNMHRLDYVWFGKRVEVNTYKGEYITVDDVKGKVRYYKMFPVGV